MQPQPQQSSGAGRPASGSGGEELHPACGPHGAGSKANPAQGWNPGLPHCRRVSHQLSPWVQLHSKEALNDVKASHDSAPALKLQGQTYEPCDYPEIWVVFDCL